MLQQLRWLLTIPPQVVKPLSGYNAYLAERLAEQGKLFDEGVAKEQTLPASEAPNTPLDQRMASVDLQPALRKSEANQKTYDDLMYGDRRSNAPARLNPGGSIAPRSNWPSNNRAMAISKAYPVDSTEIKSVDSITNIPSRIPGPWQAPLNALRASEAINPCWTNDKIDQFSQSVHNGLSDLGRAYDSYTPPSPKNIGKNIGKAFGIH